MVEVIIEKRQKKNRKNLKKSLLLGPAAYMGKMSHRKNLALIL